MAWVTLVGIALIYAISVIGNFLTKEVFWGLGGGITLLFVCCG
jgi:hypothetical protein